MLVDQLTAVAATMLGATKKHVQGVGGPSQFLTIRNGIVSAVVPYDTAASEQHALRFRRYAASLYLSMGDRAVTPAQFRKDLGDFAGRITALRQQWKADAKPFEELVDSLLSHPVKP